MADVPEAPAETASAVAEAPVMEAVAEAPVAAQAEPAEASSEPNKPRRRGWWNINRG